MNAQAYVRCLVGELLAYGKAGMLPQLFRDGSLSLNCTTTELVARLTRLCIRGGLARCAHAAAMGVGGETLLEVEAIMMREAPSHLLPR